MCVACVVLKNTTDAEKEIIEHGVFFSYDAIVGIKEKNLHKNQLHFITFLV